MENNPKRRSLGNLVRSHRERLIPDAPVGRRRTPGLRREELAARAGISSVWCAWIEQGRDIQISAKALGRLASALDLSPQERADLFELAGKSDPDAEEPSSALSAEAALKAMVEGFGQPAYALDQQWSALAWNAAAEWLFPFWLGPGRQRNLLRYAFLDRSARKQVRDWRRWARRLIGDFRKQSDERLSEPTMRHLIDALRSESSFFARSWDASAVHEVAAFGPLISMADGSVLMEMNNFCTIQSHNYKIVTLAKLDGASARRSANSKLPHERSRHADAGEAIASSNGLIG